MIVESATTATLRNSCSHKKAKTEMIGKVETNQHGWSESQFEFASSSRSINSKTTANIEPAGQSFQIQAPIQTLTSKLLTLFLIHLSQNSPNHSMQFTLIKVSQALKKMKMSRECWADQLFKVSRFEKCYFSLIVLFIFVCFFIHIYFCLCMTRGNFAKRCGPTSK